MVPFCSEGSPHDQYFYRQPDRMVAGAVAPARPDLGNEELVRAHVLSVWLAAAGARLGRGMAEVLDRGQAAYPLNPDVQNPVGPPESILAEVVEEC